MKYYLCFDVGGTEIKCGILDEYGEILGNKVFCYNAMSKCEKEIILSNLADIIFQLINFLDNPNKKIIGLAFAFPGPFDYIKGISLMQNLNKYDALYGISIKNEIKQRIDTSICKEYFSKEYKVVFEHDIKSFANGVYTIKEFSIYNRIFCLVLGTGAGSAFIGDGKVLFEREYNIPMHGYIYNIPYKNGIIEDYISTKRLNELSMNMLGKSLDGKAIFDLCEQDNNIAKEIYKIFGHDIVDSLRNIILDFNTDLIVLSGQITKSFEYFNELEGFCFKNKIKLAIENEGSKICFKGLYKIINSSF